MRTIPLGIGHASAVGQGTWRMGEGVRPAAEEADALRLGIDLGMTLIDTAEMYADGEAERVVARAIAGQRDRVFLVSKVVPSHATRAGVQKACAASLKRLGTDVLDLYLLHWPGGTPVAETVAGFEALREAGHIRAWGVSNFDVAEMRALPPGCATNQVLYHPDARGIDYDLIPWSAEHAIPVMAYSPVGQGGHVLRSKALASVAARHGATAAQVAIAWGLRHPHIISIPKASDADHVRQNAAAAALVLTPDDLAEIDAAHPPPARKRGLEML